MASRAESQLGQRLERRALGTTGLSASRLGLAGSFGIDAEAVERAYHELGINYFFVTPRMKGLVRGIQRLIAAGHRDDLVIAAGAPIPTGGSVSRSWAKQAKLFGVDTLDVFHLFWVQADWYVSGRTWPAMQALKTSGKVRALAISCHDRPRARTFVDELGLDALMIRYNAAHRGAESEIFESLGDDRPGIISYTATRWGRLLKPVKDRSPMTGPECYRFVLGHPKVDVALCGARSFDELQRDVAGVLSGPLPEDRLAEVRRFGDAVRQSATGRFGFLGT
jgi:aryl-alcohol dehydrogenase-like predicted oxidoreductase